MLRDLEELSLLKMCADEFYFISFYGTPLQKISNPVNEDDLRIIALTHYFSKQYEQFVITWLLRYVGHQLDFTLYGGVKGSSIYLITW